MNETPRTKLNWEFKNQQQKEHPRFIILLLAKVKQEKVLCLAFLSDLKHILSELIRHSKFILAILSTCKKITMIYRENEFSKRKYIRGIRSMVLFYEVWQSRDYWCITCTLVPLLHTLAESTMTSCCCKSITSKTTIYSYARVEDSHSDMLSCQFKELHDQAGQGYFLN